MRHSYLPIQGAVKTRVPRRVLTMQMHSDPLNQIEGQEETWRCHIESQP